MVTFLIVVRFANMTARLLLITLCILACYSERLVGQDRTSRWRDLDSIATFIPADYITKLDSVHDYLHRKGNNDEERIWLFYGYLGIHFKYDESRKNALNAPVFSPQYTAERRKGVCRDYTRVFMYLCDKSGIPNMEVFGRSPMPASDWLRRKLHRAGTRTNHVWNIVFYNNEWHLMDPTWSGVSRIEKFRRTDPKTKKYITWVVKIPNRQYFDVEPKEMMKDHAPNHPAFLLSEMVPTFKTVRRTSSRQKVYREGYDYVSALEELNCYEFPKFTTLYDTACIAYCKRSDLIYEYNYQLYSQLGKQPRSFKPTIEFYEERLAHGKKITGYLAAHSVYNLGWVLRDYISYINKKKERLKLVQNTK